MSDEPRRFTMSTGHPPKFYVGQETRVIPESETESVRARCIDIEDQGLTILYTFVSSTP